MKTAKDIRYRGGAFETFVIPAGTTVEPATNLSKEDEARYWAKGWRGMSASAKSWQRNYGFLLSESDVKGE